MAMMQRLLLAAVFSCVSTYQPAQPLATRSHSGMPGVALQTIAGARVSPLGMLTPPELAQSQLNEPNQLQQRPWERIVAQTALAALTAASLLTGDARVASAENELAALAGSKSTAELVNPQCFTTSCKSQVESCADSGDCMKGLLCTAKCMGDSQCTVGCFARYNNDALEKVLACTIEDAGCIAIATQAPGADSPLEAPLPPRPLVAATPASLQGKWYKVLGFNPNYDCFECQRNTFQTASVKGSSSSGSGPVVGSQAATVNAMNIGRNQAAVEVEYAMPRTRIGAAPETYRATLNEKLEFDTTPGARRTAHTEGRMFGLTFWENWYLIGQNQRSEPEFRFVYYTGKTLQNRYEGAFVYARKPELPKAAMPAIYKIAREAGFDPTRACCIDNKCFDDDTAEVAAAPQRPLFTPVAEAGTLGSSGASSSTAAPTGPFAPLRNTVRDLAELLEDPRPPADELFGRQRPMSEVREFDANGFYKRP